uniref:Delta5 desaturase n=1 Tax=Paracyclopina nana TaxID=565004 RepID=A0A1L3THS6_PARNA|nr:delta5 desaturase [Paracyclopina nana]
MEPDHGVMDKKHIRVEGKIYSAEKLAELHPGGPLFIQAFSGRDASQAFLSYHRRQFPHKRAEPAYISDDTTVSHDPQDHADFLELCQRVDKVLPRMKSFAPWHYYIKVAFILGSAFGLELYMHINRAYVWYLSALVGLFYALIGLNIQHDANHGAISRNPWVNRILGMSQNWIGGSSISWIHQHVVQHHIHTNDLERDPDIAGNAYIRLNPNQKLMRFHIVQHVYFFFLMAIYGFSVVIQTVDNILKGKHHTTMSVLLGPHRAFEAVTSALFILRWMVLPVYLTGSFMTLLHTVPMYIVAGYYLAFFFTISHNFEGVHMMEDTRRGFNSKSSFLYNQVVTSSNVGGAFLCMLNGGLNYQIEHHLFPRIQHSHYPKIAPVIRAFCEEKGIPYVHFDSINENMASCVKHLIDLGNNVNPVHITMISAAN